MKRLFPLFTLCLLLFLVESKAQSTATGASVSFSLKQAQEYALQNNITIKNSAIDIEIAKKKIWETTAIGLPQINGSFAYQHLFQVPEVSFGGSSVISVNDNIPTGTPITADMIRDERVRLAYLPGDPIKLGLADNATFDVTLSQLIFNGAYLVGLQASKTYAMISTQNLEKVKLDTKETVTGTYFLALSLTESRDILKENLESIRKTLGDMKEMNKQGFTENTDVDQISLTARNIETAVSTLGRQIDNVLTLLKMQMNMPLLTRLDLTDKLDQFIGQINLESVYGQKFDVTQNIDYKIISTTVEMSKLNMKKNLSDYLPSIAGYYRHTEKFKKPLFDMQPNDVAGVSVNVPIFSSGQRKVKYQQSKMELDKITNTRLQVEQSLSLAMITAQNDLRSANEKYRNEQMNTELAKRIYDKTLVKYKEGLSSSMDLTTTYNQYLTAQGNYFTAIFNVLQAKTKLDKLSGNL